MAVKHKDKELMTNYITQKALHKDELEEHKTTKKELMIKAGYTLDTASKNNLESTKLYAEITSELINSTGFILSQLVDSIKGDIESGVLDDMTTTTKVKLLSLITSVHKGLSPSYKQKKTEKDEDGNVKTVWTKLN